MTGGNGPDPDGTKVEIPGGQGVQIGNHNTQENKYIGQYVRTQVVQVQRASVVWPVLVGDVPQQPTAFQPRPALLAALGRSGTGVPVVRAVTGMLGVGKTQVAAAYARSRMADGWQLVAWVNAGDTAKVLNGLGEVAARLGLTEPAQDQESAAAEVRHWLEAHGEQCLLVFDNAADLKGLRPFVPASGDVQVVITSTLRAAADLGRLIEVDVFSQDEALAFLAERTGSADRGGAREVAEELGYLPLAIAQAAVVIARQRLDYGTYLNRLRTLTIDEYLTRIEADAYPRGLASAVLLSMDSAGARDSSGLPGAVLDLISILSTAGVNRALLYAAVTDRELERPTEAGEAAAAVDAALAQLADASLLTFSGDGSSVSAHRLVMRVNRELRAREGSLATTGIAAARLLRTVAASIGPVWRSPGAARDLIQQIMALHEHLTPLLTDADRGLVTELLSLRGWALWYQLELGDSPDQTIEYGRLLVADRERVLGSDYPSTLTSRNNLAAAYRSAGRIEEAIPLLERTLADHERLLGSDHPNTLMLQNNLAETYQAAGRAEEAISLLERAIADHERLLCSDHPNILMLQSNLAVAYQAAGRAEEAVSLLEHTIAEQQRVLGGDHPDTLHSQNNLATAYLAVGQPGEAVFLLEHTIAEQQRALGGDHPDTLHSQNNLATAYLAVGQPGEAISLLERTLAGQQRVLGSDHPDTRAVRKILASAHDPNMMAAAALISLVNKEGSQADKYAVDPEGAQSKRLDE
jgi:tetratricopeptide (TPR) repeat protein